MNRPTLRYWRPIPELYHNAGNFGLVSCSFYRKVSLGLVLLCKMEKEYCKRNMKQLQGRGLDEEIQLIYQTMVL